MKFISIEMINAGIRTTYMAGEHDKELYKITSLDAPRPELYETLKKLVQPIFDMVLFPRAFDMARQHNSEVAIDAMMVKEAPADEPCIWKYMFKMHVGDINLSTPWVSAYCKEYEDRNLAGTRGFVDGYLDADINAAIQEALLYINGERAQQKLDLEGTVTALGSCSPEEFEAATKKAEKKQQKKKAELHQLICDDCWHHGRKNDDTCSRCTKHSQFAEK